MIYILKNMENTLVLGKRGILTDFVESKFREKVLDPEIFRINPVLENIRAEAGADFIQYLHFLNLTKEPDLMALSATHHYFYDSNDLKSIKTLINLKKLNNVKHLESFLSIVTRSCRRKPILLATSKMIQETDLFFHFTRQQDF